MDFSICVIWWSITVLLTWSAWAWSGKLFPGDDQLQRMMHTIIFCWAVLVATSTLLGLVGLLMGSTILATVGSAAAILFWRLPRKTEAVGQGSTREERIWGWVWKGLLAIALAEVILQGVLSFPTHWDTLDYHLPIIDQWLRAGSLYAPDQAVWFVPGNNELVGLWLAAPFSGDFLVGIINLPAVVLLAVGALNFGRELGLESWFRHWTALGSVAVVPVMRQLTDPMNDLAVAGFFQVGICYGIRWVKGGQCVNLYFFAASLGLLTGVKYYALGYAGVAGIGVILLAMITEGWRRAARVVLAGLLAALLLGSYWYLRNYWWTGTPLYPLGFTPQSNLIGEIRSEAGQTTTWQTTLLGNGRPEVFPLLLDALWRHSGPCYWIAFLVMSATILWMITSWFFQFQFAQRHATSRLVFCFWCIAAGLVWGCTPFAVETAAGTFNSLRAGYTPARYGLCFLNLTFVGLALTIQDFGHATRLFRQRLSAVPANHLKHGLAKVGTLFVVPSLKGLIAAGVVWQAVRFLRQESFLNTPEGLLLAGNLMLGCVIGWLLWIEWPKCRLHFLGTCAVASTVIISLAVLSLSRRWHRSFVDYYDRLFEQKIFTELAKCDPAKTCIAVVGYRPYPFFGSERQFRVCQPYWLPNYSSLIQFLDENEVTVIAAVQFDQIGIRRHEHIIHWLREHPELFSPLQDGQGFYLCRVNRDALKNAILPGRTMRHAWR